MRCAITTARRIVDVHEQDVVQIEEAYAEYFMQFGLQLFVLPLLSDIQIIDQLQPELVLLPGGGDVPAEYYDSDVDVVEQYSRDSIEKALIGLAIRNDIPLLGICRGMQMINGFFGGKLTRDTERTHPVAVNHTIHILNNGSEYEVNSFHRDVILLSSLSKMLKAIALQTSRSHVEAFVGINHRILGLQWHPERMDEKSNCRKFSNMLISDLLTKDQL